MKGVPAVEVTIYVKKGDHLQDGNCVQVTIYVKKGDRLQER